MKATHLAALLALPLAATPLFAAEPAPPKLIVAISIDQFSADLFAQYRQHFDGGLKRLSEGVVFPSAYQSHGGTETCPGHSVILTGSRPARTGIFANSWYDQSLERPDKKVYCAEDPTISGSDSGSKRVVSPYLLRVPTLGDWMKRADPRARSVVVSGKDRAAVMLGGHDSDQRWYWSNDRFAGTGKPSPAAAVAAVNGDVAADLAKDFDAMALPQVCRPRSRAVDVAGGGAPVGAGRFARDSDDPINAVRFMASPEVDAATLDLAAGLRGEMRLGEGPATDLLAIGLSATDFIGHIYGTQGSEMCLQLMALDRALGDFFRKLDGAGIDYLVMLTADHGGSDIPERKNQHAIPGAGRVDANLAPSVVNAGLAAKFGLKAPALLAGDAFGDMYVDRSIARPTRKRVLDSAVNTYRTHPQVEAVFTRPQLAAAPVPTGRPELWSLLDRAKASFDPERSGDFVVVLKFDVTPVYNTMSGSVAAHGSPWDYDRRVPLLFWRKGLVPFEQSLPVESVDILPTLAAIVGVPIPPGSIDGRCLDLDEGPGTSCRP
ncbi:MAG TPA: alkaline phosphatase family protein [Allosphingosinicella sp.]|jgi:predicted AlkP superfamily pyrophosphatase or phosphodiesterase